MYIKKALSQLRDEAFFMSLTCVRRNYLSGKTSFCIRDCLFFLLVISTIEVALNSEICANTC